MVIFLTLFFSNLNFFVYTQIGGVGTTGPLGLSDVWGFRFESKSWEPYTVNSSLPLPLTYNFGYMYFDLKL